MAEITMRSTISAVKDQVSCNLAGEEVVLSLKNGVYYTLNPVGARIWALVQKTMTAGEVRDVIRSEYDVGQVQCERDLLVLLNELLTEGLIEVDR
jgi:hypothetical protein